MSKTDKNTVSIDELCTVVENLQADQDDARAKIVSCEHYISQLESKVRSLEGDLYDLGGKVTNLESTVNRLEGV